MIIQMIKTIRKSPELTDMAAEWFSQKWGVPKAEYAKSMKENPQKGVPEWYVITDDGGKIKAGAGIIENDFHKEKTLSPNICALYVEEDCRFLGYARRLLDKACSDLKACGQKCVYLITDHAEFYEKCGWRFYGMIEENNGNMTRMYYRKL